MTATGFQSSSNTAVAERNVKGAHPSISAPIDFARQRDCSDTSSMKIELPPPIGSELTGQATSRSWDVPGGLIQSERHFRKLLPSLLVTNKGDWVYVTDTGSYDVFDGQDAAELAAEDAGITQNSFIVRFVSDFELINESD